MLNLCIFCDELYSEPVSSWTECAHDRLSDHPANDWIWPDYAVHFIYKLRSVGL